ncbi:cupin domain-containing protein [Pelagerythrobacter marensis]|uniref:Cupin n=1 Tax=Pelagerythrobacter marensis TaxID=543877 RepID=A0A0G3XAY9_9SPHN|nr:cupin domain-containing protein [Pelagerythrobacter marensis]AKM07801.1 cupin [Pelagerythrobacter marensis]
MHQDIQRSSAAFTRAAEERIDEVDPGIRRQMLGYGPDLMVCRVWFEEGAIGHIHSHPHSQSSYVESGRFRVTIDGDERELEAGDAFYVAPFLDHGALCLEAGCLLDTFNPARADFLGEEG